ncbi:MAG: response regulator transcription factor [Anaerolineae bacterium]|nr:response regulator transcription factor [Anaerolineae bacterium]
MSQTVLIADDEVQIVRVVRGYLEKDGYRVLTAYNGRDAWFTFRHEKPDLVILDIQMPELDGLEVLRRIRAAQAGTAIIMLTSRVEETDRIVGLEMGADDYVPKPFSPRELLARVHAVLRRSQQAAPAPEILNVGPIRLDRGRREVYVQGSPVELTPTEFELLATLMQSPGRVYSRSDLLEAVQGVAFEAYERTVDAHIKNLRRKIEADPADPRFILTVRGVGYRLEDLP